MSFPMKKIQLNMKWMNSVVFAILMMTGAHLSGQEAGYLNHQYIQPILINPGAAGFQGDHQLLGGYRHVWSSFPDAARTFTGLYHGQVADNLGLGLQILTDKIGVQSVLNTKLSIAYQLDMNNAKIGFGLSAGMERQKITGVSDEVLIDPTDELLNEAINGYWLFDGGLGVYGEFNEKFIVGLSFPNLIKTRLKEIDGDLKLDEFNRFGFTGMLGYRHHVKSSNFFVEPTLTIRHLRYTDFMADVNLRLSFLDEQLVGGIGYGFGETSRASLLLGTRIDNVRIYYSYDVGLGDFQQYNNGSHEIMLVLRLPNKKAKGEITVEEPIMLE